MSESMILNLKEAAESACRANCDFRDGYLAGRAIASYETLSSVMDLVKRHNDAMPISRDAELFNLWREKIHEADELKKAFNESR